MRLLDELRKKEDVLRSAGLRIRAEAREKGTSFSYIDAAEPDVIVVELKDRTIRRPVSSKERRAHK